LGSIDSCKLVDINIRMKSFIALLAGFIIIFTCEGITNGQYQIARSKKKGSVDYVSLDGQSLLTGNHPDNDGNIRILNSPVIHLIHTKSYSPKGTILLVPGGNYEILNLNSEVKKVALFLNNEDFNVAILEYHIGKDPGIPNKAFIDALKAFRLLRSSRKFFGLSGDRLDIMGLSSGGHLAARTVGNLGDMEQPDDLILISPSYLNETLPGTVFPEVMPPVRPLARLFVLFSAGDNKEWIRSGEEYSKTWKGYDGQSSYFLLKDTSNHSGFKSQILNNQSEILLKTILEAKPEAEASVTNPAAIPLEGYASERHDEKLALISKEKFDLIFIGNSITNNFEKPEYRAVWDQFFGARHALNLGTSGYRTENIIWNIENGELDGQSPKVVILEIGTNNVDEKNYPTRNTAGQLAGGIEAIVKILREKLPNTKIIVLRCFPGCYGGPNPTSHRAILERASDIVSKLADGKHIFYCDVNHVFLNMDGSINHEMLGDWLHPAPAGAKAWAQAMEPLLSELMGEKSRDTEISSNTAIVPVPKLENDIYDWWERHAEVLRIKDSIDPEIILIGNSITHFWGGEPIFRDADGKPGIPNGQKVWDSMFSKYRVLNLGFGWDRTQNVLWRLDHGEIDGLHPRTVIINIGTNNTSETSNARKNTAEEIVEGIRAICMRVRSKVPGARIVMMALFPREKSPEDPRRILINEINNQLKKFADDNKISFVDIGPRMLEPDGTFHPGITLDYCHPTEKGYQIWADSIRSFIQCCSGR
jgi:lysophospholipase L1-like esterase